MKMDYTNVYKRNYFATHPEARKKRDEYTRKWQEENRERWNAYMREYQRKRAIKLAKEQYQKQETEQDNS